MKQRKNSTTWPSSSVTQFSSKNPFSLPKPVTLERVLLAFLKAKEITGTGSFFWPSYPLRWMPHYSSFCSWPNSPRHPPGL